jgi:hypothetical protein
VTECRFIEIGKRAVYTKALTVSSYWAAEFRLIKIGKHTVCTQKKQTPISCLPMTNDYDMDMPDFIKDYTWLSDT